MKTSTYLEFNEDDNVQSESLPTISLTLWESFLKIQNFFIQYHTRILRVGHIRYKLIIFQLLNFWGNYKTSCWDLMKIFFSLIESKILILPMSLKQLSYFWICLRLKEKKFNSYPSNPFQNKLNIDHSDPSTWYSSQKWK